MAERAGGDEEAAVRARLDEERLTIVEPGAISAVIGPGLGPVTAGVAAAGVAADTQRRATRDLVRPATRSRQMAASGK